jgi:CBS domain-containing protein
MKVREILAVKGNALFTVSPAATLKEAVATMVQEDIGSLVVFEGGRLVGLLTFREALKAIAQAGAAWEQRPVRETMLAAPMTVSPDTEVEPLREQMVRVHQRYFPVMDGETLLGVVSFHDVAKAVLEEQSFENRALKAFIKGIQDEEASC